MTHQNDYTLPSELAEKGLESVPELLRVLINNVMQVERSKYLVAADYERIEDRKGHANGYKPKTVRTRMGENYPTCPLEQSNINSTTPHCTIR